MENELNALEAKLVQLIQVSSNLRAENHRLRQELAHALSSNRQYSDKLDSANDKLGSANEKLEIVNKKLIHAKSRLEKLLNTLPEDQT